MPKIWWPNSPDCNFFDYYVSGMIESETNKTLCNTKDELKAKIMSAYTSLNKETVKRACRRFQIHLEAIIEANGNFFE